MPGTVLAVGVVGAALSLTLGLAAAGAASVVSQRAAGAADAAALAAADTASGVAGGVPCARASEVAATFGALVEICRVDGLSATIAVSIPVGPFAARDIARAGPPDATAPAAIPRDARE